ncbi:hypothetical protein PV08_11058 [Exophiala spinifera]|uniref:Major facilitator superfamily (MFS) profile domain-containing protein n=1 Tax=Exophiala spinifera TaxID=91928 RepID=A0A0D2ATQ0_9EURO|nr:uncharacterized protein PV08_11058 [Exophiala spinifera]KIW10098.1 hypothetical protein PV08_11058 [Exophiala spinifera]
MSGWKYAFSLPKRKSLMLSLLEPQNLLPEDHVRLVPQPTTTIRDPLTWPTWRKLAILFCSSYYAAVADLTSAMSSSMLPIMVYQYHPPQTFCTLTHLVSVNVIMLGGFNVFGPRPVLVIASLIMTLGSLGCALSKNSFTALLASRAIQGLGGGPADTIAAENLGDIFFVH